MGAQRRDLLAVPGLACEQNTPPHADGLAQPCVLAPVRRVASAIGSFAFLPGTTHALGACVLNVDFAAAGVHWRGSFARRTAPSGFPRNSRTGTSGCAICARQGDWDASRGVAETVDSARVAVPLRARPAPGGRLTKALTKRTVSLVAKRKRARVESHPSLPASRFVTHPT